MTLFERPDQTLATALISSVLVFTLCSCASAPATEAGEPKGSALAGAGSPQEAAHGIEVVGVSLSAEGFLVDLRYRAKSADDANAMLNQEVRPMLVNQATGDRFIVPKAPKIGSMRQTTRGKQQALHPNAVYFMLFANDQRRLKVGDKVSLVAGETTIKDLIVR
jgi:hypothetical protein